MDVLFSLRDAKASPPLRRDQIDLADGFVFGIGIGIGVALPCCGSCARRGRRSICRPGTIWVRSRGRIA